MTQTVAETFVHLRSRAQAALIPFLTAGDPDLVTTAQALRALDSHGADLLEVGLPYSDPLADGPVIQGAATRALARGVTRRQVLAMLAETIPHLQAPVILFSYYNPILNGGLENFLTQIQEVGVKGLVVPDVPLEEAAPLLESADRHGIEVILLAAPTSPPERLAAIAAQSRGFVYLVSTTGVTGVRERLAQNLQQRLELLRSLTDKPIAVGFGISQPEHARQVVDWGADGAIVGSALVARLAEGGLAEMTSLCQRLKRAILPESR
ncbi:MAG: tryptophan synthase subunit alpha [Pseudanabaenaceae cyanobacterium]